MKTTGVYLLGLATGLIITIVLCLTETMPIECGCTKDMSFQAEDSIPPTQGINMDSTQYVTLRDSFQSNLTRMTERSVRGMSTEERVAAGLPLNENADTVKGSFGGRIGRQSLVNLLLNLSPDQQYIDFTFGRTLDPLEPKTCVMFISKNVNAAGVTKYIYIRNGVDSYCPTRCFSH